MATRHAEFMPHSCGTCFITILVSSVKATLSEAGRWADKTGPEQQENTCSVEQSRDETCAQERLCRSQEQHAISVDR